MGLQIVRTTSHKNVLPLYYLAHAVKYGWMSDQDQTLSQLGDPLHQESLAIGLHVTSKLLTPYVATYDWFPNFGPHQRPPLGLSP